MPKFLLRVKKGKQANRKKTEIRIALIYLIIGILWIILSDRYMGYGLTQNIQTLKGSLFVILTTVLLYLLIKRELSKQHKLKLDSIQKKSEYKYLLENQNDLLVKVDLQGRFLFVNDRYCNYFDKTRDDLLGNSFMPLVHEDDREGTTKAMESLYHPPYMATLRQRVFAKNEWRCLEWKDTAILDENNKVVEIIGLGRDITEIKRAEHALKEAKDQLQSIFDNMTSAFAFHKIITNEKGEPIDYLFIDINKNFEKETGLKREKVIGKSVLEVIPDLRDRDKDLIKIYGDVALNGTDYDNEYFEPGFNKWFKIKAYSTTKGYFAVIFDDISEQKIIQNSLEESEEKYRNLFERSKDPILIIENDKFVDCNQAAIDLLKYSSKQDITDKYPWDLSPQRQPDGRNSKTKGGEIISETKTKGYHRFEWVHVDSNNNNIYVEVTLTRIKDKGRDVIYTIWRNITKRKTIEKALDKSQKNFKIISENTSDFILLVDSSFVLQYVSPSIVNMLGYTAEEIHSKKIFEFIHPSDSKDIIKQILSERKKHVKSSTFLKRGIKKNGEIIWIEMSIERMFDSEGNLDYSVCIGRDATARINNETKLKQALKKAQESDRLKSAFLANMSHEIRTPLNGILGFSEILASDSDLDDESRFMYSEIIKSSGDQLLGILNDILDISRIEAQQVELKIEQINIQEILEDLHKLYTEKCTAKGLDLIIENNLEASDTVIFGDIQRVYQVLANLINNAIKFTNKGDVIFGLKNENTLYVKDTGIGIAKENHKKIFDRFIQVNPENDTRLGGTGLGLSICKSLLKMMHGKIWIESEEGKGSTFFFTLPNKACEPKYKP